MSKWGSLAYARSGLVELSVDCSLVEPDRYALALDLPSIALRLELRNTAIISTFNRFLQANFGHKQFADFALGTLMGADVTVRKDDEFADQFFLCAGRAGDGAGVFLTLEGRLLADLMAAVEELNKDLIAK